MTGASSALGLPPTLPVYLILATEMLLTKMLTTAGGHAVTVAGLGDTAGAPLLGHMCSFSVLLIALLILLLGLLVLLLVLLL